MLTDGKHKPNPNDETRCQCVWDHNDPAFFRTMEQCTSRRMADGNRFCRGCEETHGVIMRKKEAAATSE